MVRIEPATIEDLPELTDLAMQLFELEQDFTPNRENQENGIRLILEQPNRGRIFVLRTSHEIVGMVILMFSISTAMGGFVLLLEDFFIHPDFRGQGYGSRLLDYVLEFAKKKDFLRITLLTDKISDHSQNFFKGHGFAYSAMIPMRLVMKTDD